MSKIYTSQIPTEIGKQFIAVWEYNGKVWAESYQVTKYFLDLYHSESDVWRPVDREFLGWYTNDYNVKFILKGN